MRNICEDSCESPACSVIEWDTQLFADPVVSNCGASGSMFNATVYLGKEFHVYFSKYERRGCKNVNKPHSKER